MSGWVWAVAAAVVVGWPAVAWVVAVVLGRAIRLADRRSAFTGEPLDVDVPDYPPTDDRSAP